jgi:two-component system, OmpR family, sensor kinase
MTLRRRLLLALGGMLLVLALALVGVRISLQAYLISQVDARLLTLAGDARQVVAIAQRAANGTTGPATALVSDLWVGGVGVKGRMVTVEAPSDDPELVPQLDGAEPVGRAVERATASGRAASVRVVVAQLNDRRRVAFAVPLTEVDAATNRLTLMLGLAWLAVAAVSAVIAVWAYRLGLRPIARMTAVARAVTGRAGAGEAIDARVPPGRPGTEAAELGDALNTMLDSVEASAARQRRFVADASHELRTPLTTLMGYSELYAAGALSTSDAVADAMRRINSEAARMAGLVDHLLALSTSDATPLVLSSVDLGALLGDVAADLRAGAPDRVVEVAVAPGLSVRADASRVQQALLALGTNAVRHGAGPIRLAARADADGVRIEVSDAGPGIPAAEQDAIFEPFHRASPGTRGSGLGLPLVAAIVRAHGGRVGVTSAPGAGTTFWLTLPSG